VRLSPMTGLWSRRPYLPSLACRHTPNQPRNPSAWPCNAGAGEGDAPFERPHPPRPGQRRPGFLYRPHQRERRAGRSSAVRPGSLAVPGRSPGRRFRIAGRRRRGAPCRACGARLGRLGLSLPGAPVEHRHADAHLHQRVEPLRHPQLLAPDVVHEQAVLRRQAVLVITLRSQRPVREVEARRFCPY
jgi:hypothetical protein